MSNKNLPFGQNLVSRFAPPKAGRARNGNNIIKVIFDEWDEYELLDSGQRQKLERFGDHILIREEPRAWWEPELPKAEWEKAGAIYHHEVEEDRGRWVFKNRIPQEWLMRFDNLQVKAKLTTMSKHLGVFPEQSSAWRWIREKVHASKQQPIHLLNLFGYTGIASLIAAREGAWVTHVEASKVAIGWGMENQRLSGLAQAHIRWLLDDAARFIKREKRREKRYDAIILDPPAFGRGPSKQVWKIEDNLLPLLKDCRELLSDKPIFVILTTYNIEGSSLSLGNMLRDMLHGFDGFIEIGEFALKPKRSEQVLPMSIFARWEKN